ncbi:uncharacterized protein LOC118514279 [Anopheles stephensi]|uniref:uncharacterized protein LOC118514279 n=1 Tax=Anopheles stephensi TaxID=30069 RepID=UPI0016588834|nr:uncharacterized protein LOC118514279 [Anopheles stephensi]
MMMLMIMEKASVLLVFAVCVLQTSFVAASPDFGVDVSIRGSVAVQRTAVRVEERFEELTVHMDFMLVSSYEKLGLLQNQVTYLVHNLTTIGTAFAMALNSATTSNSDVVGTFEPLIYSVSRLQTIGVSDIVDIVGEIRGLVGQYLSLQLEDSFETLHDSVQKMFGALIQLVSAIQTASSPSNINWLFVNNLNRAVNVVRGNVVPLNYTIASTGENIRESDAFLSRLSGRLELAETAVENEEHYFKSQVDLVANATLLQADCSKQRVSGLAMAASPFVQTLCGFSKNLAECALQTAVQSVVQMSTTEWDRVVGVVRRYFDNLREESAFVQEVVGRFSSIYNLGLLLADVTISQRPYSLYCFHKFAHLIEQLVTRLTDGLVVCFNEEHTRLRSLQTGLVHMFATLVYDVEDLVEHLQFCTVLEQRSECVTIVTMLYERLAAQLEEKLEAIEKFSIAETTASNARLRLCVYHTQATVFTVNIDQVRSDIVECSEQGPLEHPYSMESRKL